MQPYLDIMEIPRYISVVLTLRCHLNIGYTWWKVLPTTFKAESTRHIQRVSSMFFNLYGLGKQKTKQDNHLNTMRTKHSSSPGHMMSLTGPWRTGLMNHGSSCSRLIVRFRWTPVIMQAGGSVQADSSYQAMNVENLLIASLAFYNVKIPFEL